MPCSKEHEVSNSYISSYVSQKEFNVMLLATREVRSFSRSTGLRYIKDTVDFV